MMNRRPHARHLRGPAANYFPGGAMFRVGSMICCLLILGMIYSHAKNPQTWRWLVNDREPVAQKESGQDEAVKKSAPAPMETIVLGPTDDDPEESKAAQPQFDIQTDRAPLAATEMPAYWTAMRWARAQSFDDLSRRARENVRYAELWEQSDEFRGDLLKLRVHIRRVISYDAPENSAGVAKVYEAWGWTDDSKSFPYILVFSELPSGMKVGAEVHEEGVFVGYFLKTMLYTAYDANRAAPLLVGRLRHITSPTIPRRSASGTSDFWTTVAGGAIVLIVGWFVFRYFRRTKYAAELQPPVNEAALEDWLRDQTDAEATNGAERDRPTGGSPPDRN
ncbi:MAG: hypothetical protein AB7O26_18605 [Planctomycetaceae bacterium]